MALPAARLEGVPYGCVRRRLERGDARRRGVKGRNDGTVHSPPPAALLRSVLYSPWRLAVRPAKRGEGTVISVCMGTWHPTEVEDLPRLGLGLFGCLSRVGQHVTQLADQLVVDGRMSRYGCGTHGA